MSGISRKKGRETEAGVGKGKGKGGSLEKKG